MAKKRSYDINSIRSEYEDKLEKQEEREQTIVPAPQADVTSPFTYVPEEPYVNPDKEDYKRLSLFMDFATWERLQALCWNQHEAVNKILVNKLREWSRDVDEETVARYREYRKQQHLAEWEEQRRVLREWWQTSGLYDQMQVASYKMNRDNLTVTETNGNVRKYFIHRGWITDGHSKLAKVKSFTTK